MRKPLSVCDLYLWLFYSELEYIPSSEDNYGETFFQRAARYGATDLMTWLLHTLSPHIVMRLLTVKDICKLTPLHMAAENTNHPDVMKVLLESILKTCKISGKSKESTHKSKVMFVHSVCALFWCPTLNAQKDD